MTIRTYEFVDCLSLCRTVDRPSSLSQDKAVYVARPGFTESVDLPDFPAAPADTAGIGDAFLARFDNVLIDRYSETPYPTNTFNVFVAPGLALGDGYSCRYSTDMIVKILGEEVTFRHGGSEIAAKIYDDGRIDQTVEGAALMLACRFSIGNYFHWMVDVLPRLWALDLFDQPDSVPLILPANKLARYAEETLAALRVRNPLIRLNCHMARIGTLYFPSYYSPGGYSREHVSRLSRRLRAAFGVEGRPAGRRLYISRNDVVARRVVNEDAVLKRLQHYGFEAVTLSGLSVAEQAELFAGAEIVVAPHGAGNTNMLFAPPGAALIETVPRSIPNMCYWMLVKQNGQRYGRMLSDEYDRQGLAFDIDKLIPMVEQALSR